MLNENMSKSRLTTYHITEIVSPLWEIIATEIDGDCSF